MSDGKNIADMTEEENMNEDTNEENKIEKIGQGEEAIENETV